MLYDYVVRDADFLVIILRLVASGFAALVFV